MKLYMFEHCSLCFRVRMIAALKQMPLQEIVVRDDDSDTVVGLIGTRSAIRGSRPVAGRPRFLGITSIDFLIF